MDLRLVAWARAVKSRTRWRTRQVPPLWLFTDTARLAELDADLCKVIERLPKGLCGVVFRHDGVTDRAQLIIRLWRICRVRRLMMVVSGGGARPAGVGRHVRRGQWVRVARTGPISTSSAHGLADLVRATQLGVKAAFLSPIFPTASHRGAPGLGVVRWAAMARRVRRPAVLALGGIDGRSIRRLPRWVQGAGAIGALIGE